MGDKRKTNSADWLAGRGRTICSAGSTFLPATGVLTISGLVASSGAATFTSSRSPTSIGGTPTVPVVVWEPGAGECYLMVAAGRVVVPAPGLVTMSEPQLNHVALGMRPCLLTLGDREVSLAALKDAQRPWRTLRAI